MATLEAPMITEDQSDVIALLGSPSTHAGANVERLDTHASVVFLAGDRAWKLKRAVRYDYLDFSTAGRRKAMCERELAINRGAAPRLYHRVVPVTRARDGTLALGGSGEPVDWVLEMSRFDQEQLLDRLASRGSLPLDVMPRLARTIASFHSQTDPCPTRGGRAGLAWVIDGNAAGFADRGAGILDPVACAALTAEARSALDRHAGLLEQRRVRGLVRRCHGDLHLRNIVLLDGEPTLFDAVEFNDEIACIDTLYDVAFVVMDLWRRRLPRHANALFNAYIVETAEEDVALLPLFLSCRAAVRAKTSATAARLEPDQARKRALQGQAREYLAMARELLRPPRPCLVAVGGLSGSGKSTVAMALAPTVGAVPGAVVVRSDEIRKRRAGVTLLSRLGPESYTSEVSAQVYQRASDRASAVAAGGHAAIVDAVFARPVDRAAIEKAAGAVGVPFVGLWLDAPGSLLVERVSDRRLDPSDADAAVVGAQLAQDPGVITWHRIETARPAGDVLADAVACVRAATVR